MAYLRDKAHISKASGMEQNVVRNFGYPKPLNLIVKETMLQDTEMYPLWAAYFNMARHNMYTALVHIAAATGLSDEENMENRMAYMRVLREDAGPEIELSLRRLLCIHFPFIVWMCSARGGEIRNVDDKGILDSLSNLKHEDILIPLQDLRYCIKQISYTLNYYRNLYSHTRDVETRSEEDIVRSRNSEKITGIYLKRLGSVSARRVKIRFADKCNKCQVGMIDDQSLKFITEEKVKFHPKMENGSPVLDKYGRQIKEAKDNPDYFLNPLVQDKNGTLRDGTNPERLSTAGKIQLVCLLLDKKYITEFLTQTKFLDAFNDDAPAPKLSDRRLILEVLSDLRIKTPKKKIDSTRDDMQVALDMLNELKKCPKELFDLLDPKDKSTFDVVSSSGEHVFLLRSSDRFTQLALQWFDVNKVFNRIRFQVNAGVFRYLFNESKICIDGKTRLRVLQEPINCFGRLQEVEEIRDSHREGKDGPWAGFEIKGFDEAVRNDANCLPYINDARTRYLVDCGNIGIRFGEQGEPNGDHVPSIVYKDGKYDMDRKPAQCSMSIYELQAMLFLHLINPGAKGEQAPVEKIIIDKVEAFRRLFTDIRDGRLMPEGLSETSLDAKLSSDYGLSLSDVPDKLKDYLSGETGGEDRFSAYRRRLVNMLKEDTECRIGRLRKNLEKMSSDMNKPGKPGYVDIRPGAIASFIAKDIVFFQDGNADQKMTGLNYSIMQGLIATFGSREGTTAADIISVFRNAGLIAADGACGTHPFLATAFNSGANNTVALYMDYLKARKVYLSGPIPDSAPFFHVDRVRWAVRDDSYYREYAERCLKRPVKLPRGLFVAAIKDKLLSLSGRNADELKEEIRSAGDRCNTSFMIDNYFFHVQDDNPQVFHGTCEGDMVHIYGYKFFQLVRKNLKDAESILAGLKKDCGKNHKTYIDALSVAIGWAKENPVSEPKRTARCTMPKTLSREEISAIIRRAFNEYTATEKTLRRYVVQDELLFMASMRTIKGMLDVHETKLKLGNVGPRTASVLDTVLPSVKAPARFYNVKRDSNSHGIIEKDSVNFSIEQRDIPLKDYGEVYRLLSDERLYGLLKYHKNEVVLASDLKSELEEYDRKRVGVFRAIMDYERKVTLDVTDRQLCDAMSEVNSKNIDFKVMQRFDTENDALTKNELRSIRNAFCHNTYPAKEVFIRNSSEKRILHNAEVPGTADEVSDRAMEISARTKSK